MITEAIIGAFKSVTVFILSIIPNLPQIPQNIQDATNSFINTISSVVGVISYLYTPVIFVLIFTILIAVINFEVIYKMAIWVYHKIRG